MTPPIQPEAVALVLNTYEADLVLATLHEVVRVKRYIAAMRHATEGARETGLRRAAALERVHHRLALEYAQTEEGSHR